MVEPLIAIAPLSPLFRKLLAEFLGTFFLVFSIALNLDQATAGQTNAALAIGATLMVNVFAFGHVSGAFFNPAVTLAATLTGNFTLVELFSYWFVQIIGALCAAFLALFVVGNSAHFPVPAPVDDGGVQNVFRAVFAEFVYTVMLCSTVLHVALSKQGKAGNSFFGLAIGFAVLAGAYSAGSVSGGAFNPAVVTGLQIAKCGAGRATTCAPLKWWVVYVGTELLAGVCAFVLYSLMGAWPDGDALTCTGDSAAKDEVQRLTGSLSPSNEHHGGYGGTAQQASLDAMHPAASQGSTNQSMTQY